MIDARQSFIMLGFHVNRSWCCYHRLFLVLWGQLCSLVNEYAPILWARVLRVLMCVKRCYILKVHHCPIHGWWLLTNSFVWNLHFSRVHRIVLIGVRDALQEGFELDLLLRRHVHLSHFIPHFWRVLHHLQFDSLVWESGLLQTMHDLFPLCINCFHYLKPRSTLSLESDEVLLFYSDEIGMLC